MPITWRLEGAEGGKVSGPVTGRVVNVTVLLAFETLPAASNALTVRLYVVLAVRLVRLAEVAPFVVAIWLVPLKTRYPETPTLSVEAPQEIVAVVVPILDDAALDGVEGATVSELLPPLKLTSMTL